MLLSLTELVHQCGHLGDSIVMMQDAREVFPSILVLVLFMLKCAGVALVRDESVEHRLDIVIVGHVVCKVANQVLDRMVHLSVC